MTQKIGVLGAGQMGCGITQVASQAGYTVVLLDVVEAQLGKALTTMEKNLKRLLEKGSFDAVAATMGRVTTTTSMEAVA